MDDAGNPIDDVIEIVSYGDNAGLKHNPRVTYNYLDDIYFVAFDYVSVFSDNSKCLYENSLKFPSY
jgi:hypothetical protein